MARETEPQVARLLVAVGCLESKPLFGSLAKASQTKPSLSILFFPVLHVPLFLVLRPAKRCFARHAAELLASG